MYRILCDGKILYDPILQDFPLSEAKLEMTNNKAGTLEITVPAENKSYGLAKLMKSTVELYEDNKLIFSGRPYAPSRDLFSNKKILIAGELSYLNDSVHEPFEFFGLVNQFFNELIENHNSQSERKFKVGICDVVNDTDSGNIVRSSEEVLSTWEIIEKKLVEMLGGFLRTRHEADGIYIDYLKDAPLHSDQTVEDCINLLDIEEKIDTDSLATVVYPLGVKESNTNKRITIESVNNGSKFIVDEKNKALYGSIVKVIKHDDITEPLNLKKAGERDLLGLKAFNHLKVTATDLSKAGHKINSFRVGQKVKITIKQLEIEQEVVVDKLSLDLLNPEESKLEVGKEIKLTDGLSDLNSKVDESIVKSNAAEHKAEENLNVIEETKRVLENTIVQSADTLRTEISDSTYTKKDTDDLVSQKLTEFEQDPESFSYRFVEYDKTLSEHNQRIEERESYINFEDGNIKLGKSDSNASTTITNEQFQVEVEGEVTSHFDKNGTHSRNVEVENQISHFGNWATCKGAKSSKGNNLNVMWIGG